MKPTLKLIWTLFLFLSSFVAFGQTNDWRDYLQQLGENGTNAEQIESMYEDLADIETNPLNLNSVTMDDLRRLPFLSEDQRQSINDFLEKNRPVYSIYELRNIPLLDANTIQIMLPFFIVRDYAKIRPKRSLLSIIKNGKNELQLRFDKVLPKRAGYKYVSDSILEKYPNRIYRGEDFYHSLKYAYTAGRNFQAGVVAEKDAGEPFFKKEHKAYDHYGAYIALKDLGKLRSFVLGDFRLSFGQGLVLNNNFSLGKTSATTAITKRTTLPTRHASTAESGYFRGLAAAYMIGEITVTAFFSYHKIDANLSGDSIFTSFKTDGYHRTQLEQSKKENLLEQVAGANIQFQKNRLTIGASILHYRYGKPYQPSFQEYNRFYFRGKNNVDGSVDYSYRFRRFSVAGEFAVSQNGSMATLNTVNFYPKQGIAVSILQRQFGRSYQAQYANAFSDGSNVQNETGWYVGAQFNPIARLKVSTYADIASFPWLKYGINTPSRSYDYFIQGNYKYNDSFVFDLRYRFREREANVKYPDEQATSVLPYRQHKLLFQLSKDFSATWSTKTILDWNSYQTTHFTPEIGWMVSQLVSWRSKQKCKADFFIGYFNSDSYDVRVYSREKNVINTFYMPSFYEKGLRSALAIRYDLQQNVSFALKGGFTNYFDRDTIGSDLEEIDANHRLDVMAYMRWRF